MGFSKIITIEQQTGSGANPLNGRGNLPALSSIAGPDTDAGTYPAIRLNQTLNEFLTAYVLDAYMVQETYNGGIIYKANQNGIFTYYNGDTTPNVMPYQLYRSLIEGYNTLTFSLSATGQECASGIQIGTVYWTLSSTALSGTSAGTVIPVTVSNSFGPNLQVPSISAATQVFCRNSVNTNFDPLSTYVCDDDRRRMTIMVQG